MKIKNFNLNKVYIDGYADKTGGVLFNRKLSQDRAEITADYLKLLTKGSGIQIIIDASGKDNPPVSTPEGMSEPLNRSVSIVLSNERVHN